jgi:hypothetical protein
LLTGIARTATTASACHDICCHTVWCFSMAKPHPHKANCAERFRSWCARCFQCSSVLISSPAWYQANCTALMLQVQSLGWDALGSHQLPVAHKSSCVDLQRFVPLEHSAPCATKPVAWPSLDGQLRCTTPSKLIGQGTTSLYSTFPKSPAPQIIAGQEQVNT